MSQNLEIAAADGEEEEVNLSNISFEKNCAHTEREGSRFCDHFWFCEETDMVKENRDFFQGKKKLRLALSRGCAEINTNTREPEKPQRQTNLF